jgi:hypothetical protein
MSRSRFQQILTVLGMLITAPTLAAADEGGVSFWLPGLFGSLAAVPQQPGFSLSSGIVDNSGRERGHGNIDANDPNRTNAGRFCCGARP